MNVAGKSLQDIYDAGSRRLEELENAEKKQLGESADSHLEACKQAEPQTLKQLQERSGALEQEIRAYLAQGLDRVNKAVGAEATQTENYIQRLVNGLDLLAKKFSESIAQLRGAAETQLSHLSSDQEQLYKTAAQAAQSRLNREGGLIIDTCRSEGAESHADLVGCVDGAWDAVLESEDEVVTDVLSNFDASAERLSQTARECKKSVDDELASRLAKLELRSLQATEAVRSLVERILSDADRHAFDCDVHLKERFSALMYETTTAYEESSQRSLADIAQLHDSSMGDLTAQSRELNAEMDHLVAGITGGATDKLGQLQDKGKKLIDDFTDDLDKRHQSSDEFRKDLEKERLEMVSEIWRELRAVRDKFEMKLSGLAKNTLDKMQRVCDEAETAIVSAQHSCAADSKLHAGEKQQAIEQAAAEFMARINSTRNSALDAIGKAAGAGSGESRTAAEAESAGGGSRQDDASVDGEKSIAGEDPGTSGSYESRRRKRSSKQSDKREEGNK